MLYLFFFIISHVTHTTLPIQRHATTYYYHVHFVSDITCNIIWNGHTTSIPPRPVRSMKLREASGQVSILRWGLKPWYSLFIAYFLFCFGKGFVCPHCCKCNGILSVWWYIGLVYFTLSLNHPARVYFSRNPSFKVKHLTFFVQETTPQCRNSCYI